MRKILLLIVTVIFMVTAFAGVAVAASDEVVLNFNGKSLPSDVPPVIQSGRTLVPVRVISEALGADVSWDAQLQKITITKNDAVVTLLINNKEVLKNGEKLTELDVPAKIISGRTFVPVRFVSQALGADVGWNNNTRTVLLTFEEKRDGMTPEELMLKCSEVMLKNNSYKFKGKADMLITMAGKEPVKTSLDMDGAYRKTGNKTEVYIKEAISVPPMEGAPAVSLDVQIYTDGSAVYQKIGTGSWQKQQLNEEITAMLQNQDPQKSLAMMKDFNLIIAHGNEVTINDKQYYTLVVKIDGEKYKAFMKDMLSKLTDELAGGQANNDEFSQLMEELVNGLNIDMSEKLFIDKTTFVADKTLVNGKIAFSAAGNDITEEIKMEMNIYDLGKDVTMPDLNV